MEVVLSTHEVTKIYELDDQKITAVDRVSLDLYAGEFVALVGPSGSGKTSMLAMIAGLLTPYKRRDLPWRPRIGPNA